MTYSISLYFCYWSDGKNRSRCLLAHSEWMTTTFWVNQWVGNRMKGDNCSRFSCKGTEHFFHILHGVNSPLFRKKKWQAEYQPPVPSCHRRCLQKHLNMLEVVCLREPREHSELRRFTEPLTNFLCLCCCVDWYAVTGGQECAVANISGSNRAIYEKLKLKYQQNKMFSIKWLEKGESRPKNISATENYSGH